MLQQTRVATVIPYYHRFLETFPTIGNLAQAPEPNLLAAWAGLGYYSRARNVHRAAKQILEQGGFPETYEEIRQLPGIGDYTAAAVASIAFGLPHAAVDGNVLRVISRLTADAGDITAPVTKQRIAAAAQALLERRRPGDFNQAMMELGATICLPRDPQCLLCPWSKHCEARLRGIQNELPVKRRDNRQVDINLTVLLIRRGQQTLLWQRGEDERRLAGFWELPEASSLLETRPIREIGAFRHQITFHKYTVNVVESEIGTIPTGYEWVSDRDLPNRALSTIARKALRLSNFFPV
jgi:A/G-specific adenine glycosylase